MASTCEFLSLVEVLYALPPPSLLAVGVMEVGIAAANAAGNRGGLHGPMWHVDVMWREVGQGAPSIPGLVKASDLHNSVNFWPQASLQWGQMKRHFSLFCRSTHFARLYNQWQLLLHCQNPLLSCIMLVS